MNCPCCNIQVGVEPYKMKHVFTDKEVELEFCEYTCAFAWYIGERLKKRKKEENNAAL